MNITINKKDLQKSFGVTALQGYLKAITTPPVLKNFEKTEWKDEHGVDYNLMNTEPAFEARAVSIPFYAKSELDYHYFVAYLESNIENVWHFEAIDREYTFRLTGSSGVSQHRDGWWFTLTFSEDKPMERSIENPTATGIETGYTVDDMDFGCFGLRFLKGYIQELEKPFPIKQNLTIASNQTSGLLYPNKNTCFAPQTVKLPAFFRGSNVLQMLDAFVWKLTRPGYRTFGAPSGETFPFIYKSVEIIEIIPNDWLKVNINLEFQVDEVFDVLIDSLGSYIVDEENTVLTHILQKAE